jgi:hypothetical protein
MAAGLCQDYGWRSVPQGDTQILHKLGKNARNDRLTAPKKVTICATSRAKARPMLETSGNKAEKKLLADRLP